MTQTLPSMTQSLTVAKSITYYVHVRDPTPNTENNTMGKQKFLHRMGALDYLFAITAFVYKLT